MSGTLEEIAFADAEARRTILGAGWQRASDAASFKDIISSTFTLKGEWKNLKSFLGDGRVPGMSLHALSGGRMGHTAEGVPEVTILNSAKDTNDLVVAPRSATLERALRHSGIDYAIDRNFWECGEEKVVLEGKAADRIRELTESNAHRARSKPYASR